MRLRILLVCCAVIALSVGVAAAYGALGVADTATGTAALGSESSGDFNTADGYAALSLNTTGSNNTAAGANALTHNTTGVSNTAVGHDALLQNLTGSSNTATGADALFFNVGSSNTADGSFALFDNYSGSFNTAVGPHAGEGDFVHPNLTGSNNTFLGSAAAPGTGNEINNATAVGANAIVSRSDSLVLGASGVNVGINSSTPQSRLQIGSGATSSWGDYLQLPVVNSIDKTPPAGDCNTTTFVGRMVIQHTLKKMYLWACSPTGVWVRV
jgi:hypothetical protein